VLTVKSDSVLSWEHAGGDMARGTKSTTRRPIGGTGKHDLWSAAINGYN